MAVLPGAGQTLPQDDDSHSFSTSPTTGIIPLMNTAVELHSVLYKANI